MNIKITHNWLLEYLDTDATPYEIQKYLSLCGPSVEHVEKVEDDFVYDIEITSNRIDTASVFGIAQEAQAILPQFGKKGKLRFDPLQKYKFPNINVETGHAPSLQIKITDPTLCTRFTAVVLKNVNLKPSPAVIKQRLNVCGIKSINNIIDISNYLMLSLGQPTHVFDYDKIGKSIMIMRESKKGEKITTLDEKEITLPGGDIVIEDGKGKLIDLCGIMGGLNSAVSNQTKNIILFIQTYNKQKIRKTSMQTGARTVAATYFEKGLDEERVEPTLVYGIKMIEELSGAKIGSYLYDIYPHPYHQQKISLTQKDVDRIIGVEIDKNKIVQILQNLGFDVETGHAPSLQYIITVPSWRKNDVSIKEDIVEEIARVYGYHNLRSHIQPTVYVVQPKELERLFSVQHKSKYLLKHIGLNEVMNFSMISKEILENLSLDPKKHLRLSNTLSSEIEFLRQSLIPSLVKNIKENEGRKEILKLFEIAKVYLPLANDLPNEIYKLGIAVTTDFFDLKGIIEALLQDLNIQNYQTENSNDPLFSGNIQAQIVIDGKKIGSLGALKSTYLAKNGIRSPLFLAEIDFQALVSHYQLLRNYQNINPFASIKLDLTIETSPDKNYAQIQKKAFNTSKLLQKIEVISVFGNKITIRFYFSSTKKNLTEEEAKKELERIKEEINK